MAYELLIWAEEGAPKPTVRDIVSAFAMAGLHCTEQPDEFGYWLVLKDFESALDLTLTDGVPTGANFRFASEDDETIIQTVAEVFKGLGWSVSDDNGTFL